jgi:uncharacterized protein YceK
MKKLLLLIIPILLLCGCQSIKGTEVDEKSDYKGEAIDIITYCDKKYGIEYLIYLEGHRGGISVRLDEDGNVIHCK